MDSSIELLHWEDAGSPAQAYWHSANHSPKPKRIICGDDTITADRAYRLACEGTAIIWKGDFQNAKLLLQAVSRRMQKKKKESKQIVDKTNDSVKSPPSQNGNAFHLHRRDQVQKSRILGMLLIPIHRSLQIQLRRAPEAHIALANALDEEFQREIKNSDTTEFFVMSLRELLGIIGAFEWQKNGVEIASLGAKIFPDYGVYSPIRGEYLDLIAKAPLPSTDLAFDIGTGTGVIAALLAKRGIKHIIATEINPRALACAHKNLEQLGCLDIVELMHCNLFPDGQAPLIVCNPPWLPAKPSSNIESAVYDPESTMLKAFLGQLPNHLSSGGEAWLIMSDLAEHLGLRGQTELWDHINAAGLQVVGKMDIRPQHRKSSDPDDPLHEARRKEVTSLWRLKKA